MAVMAFNVLGAAGLWESSYEEYLWVRFIVIAFWSLVIAGCITAILDIIIKFIAEIIHKHKERSTTVNDMMGVDYGSQKTQTKQ